ncbi:MAG: exodeoxyribonuclease VII small subunit [Candidatus Eisenbacteria bacterium]|nr:exodeoxyribonuclease VII small subunit [Candidatus Eisenbacteria bacterium]
MAKKTAADSGPQPSFEEALKRLETIVEELEGGELSLEDSIARYEEGTRLSRRLTQQLDEAEKRIERLSENEAGETSTEPLELEERPGAPEGELPF